MTSTAAQQGTVSAAIIERWIHMNQKLKALAEALPESKFDYRPMDGVRTSAEVLRHVAFWNRYVADSARGRKADETANELSRDEFSTKAQVIDALADSAADAADALKGDGSGLSLEMTEMVVTFVEHTSEHYGQLVVYARLNGVIPPASRG